MFSIIPSRDIPSRDIPSRDVAAANDAFNNSAPSIILSPPPSDDHTIRRGGSNHSIDSLMRKRSSMSSRTLHESLHRGKCSSSSNTTIDSVEGCIRRSVSFSQVNIREYERVRGVNSDVFGAPLSIGWRYSPDQITHDVSDYEQAKGSPRSTNEFLVPARVRERMIKEFEKGDDNNEIVNNNNNNNNNNNDNSSGRRHSISFGKEEKKQTKREKFMDISRKLKEALKPPSLARIPPYEEREKQLWDDAHQIAVEKAKRLEDSIRRGESISSIDLYAVGSPQCNILPSRRNSSKVAATISTDDMGGDQSNQSGNIVVTENEDLISELIEAADCEA